MVFVVFCGAPRLFDGDRLLCLVSAKNHVEGAVMSSRDGRMRIQYSIHPGDGVLAPRSIQLRIWTGTSCQSQVA